MSITSSTATSPLLNGISLPVVRSVFVILAMATLIFFAMGVPLYHARLIQSLDAGTLEALRGRGMNSDRTHRAILMDFGIAHFVNERTKLTMTGDMLGTAEYISPEQIQGVTDLDGRADQYSLGVLVYMTVTGKKQFERNNTWAMIKSHLEEPAPDAREIVPISEMAAHAIMKAMSKKPEERFTSVGEFIIALEQ